MKNQQITHIDNNVYYINLKKNYTTQEVKKQEKEHIKMIWCNKEINKIDCIEDINFLQELLFEKTNCYVIVDVNTPPRIVDGVSQSRLIAKDESGEFALSFWLNDNFLHCFVDEYLKGSNINFLEFDLKIRDEMLEIQKWKYERKQKNNNFSK